MAAPACPIEDGKPTFIISLSISLLNLNPFKLGLILLLGPNNILRPTIANAALDTNVAHAAPAIPPN